MNNLPDLKPIYAKMGLASYLDTSIQHQKSVLIDYSQNVSNINIVLSAYFHCKRENVLQRMIVKTDILVMPIFHSKAVGNSSHLLETQSLIEMPCMNIRFYDSIKLQDFVPVNLGLFQAVIYKLFANMKPPALTCDSITRITDMSASSHIIGMKNV